MISLTPRQQDALRFIIGYQERNGVGPLLKEIAEALSCRSTYVASWLLGALEERGAVVRLGAQWRAIVVLRPIAIPRAPDGEPLHFIRIGESAA
jgi:SOS-response transcriptional repressor LexA